MKKLLVAGTVLAAFCTGAYAMSCKECDAEYSKNFKACRSDATCEARAMDALRDCKKGCSR